jgi:hypothetical protein
VPPRNLDPVRKDALFPKPRPAISAWVGLVQPSGRRGLDTALGLVVALFFVGWIYVIGLAVTGDQQLLAARTLTANPFSATAPPGAAFVLDELVRTLAEDEEVRGESGAVDVLVLETGDSVPLSLPAELGEGVHLEYRAVREGGLAEDAPGTPVRVDSGGIALAPSEPGVWGLVAVGAGAAREVPGVRLITQVPLSLRREGRMGAYLIGEWPFERGGDPPSEAYRPPSGIIEVTPENFGLQISEHLRLGDFLTKGQVDVWPKYVLISPRLLDKVELTLQEMERRGHQVDHIGVISGFRTPSYNVHGGDTSGRGALSRHMYGDALDFFLDNDEDGRMDDLNGDGQIGAADAQVLADAADAVEKAHPALVGGIGVYAPTGAHSGFVHLDTRGYRARW